jgi:hypothetical protein
VLARLIGRSRTPTLGVFELGDGRRVEVEGGAGLDAADAPVPGQKAFVVMDQDGQAIRWEPYRDLRRGGA